MLSLGLRYAWRLARRTPFLTSVVVLVLAGGVAVTTVVFGLVNAVWLRPLPYPHAARLVAINEVHPRLGHASLLSPAAYEVLQGLQGGMEALGGFNECTFALGRVAAHAERVRGARVDPRLLRLLAAAPLAGRSMSAEDSRQGAEPIALVSERFSTREAGSPAAIVGKSLRLDGVETKVVGVLPYAFKLFNSAFDVFTPLSLASADRHERSLLVVARLAPGSSAETATARLETLAWSPRAAVHAGEPGWKPVLRPLDAVLWGEARPAFLLLLAAALLLLALITANVSNLLLARSEARREEFAIRLALGAGRPALARQLVIEGMLLAGVSATLALVLCLWLQSLLIATVPEMTELRLDSRVFAFAACTAVLAGLAFGLLPAWSVTRGNLADGLRRGAMSAVGGRRAGRLLAASQLAAAAAVLTCCGLLLRGALAVRTTDAGFDPARMLTASVSLPQTLYPAGEQRETFYRELARRVATLPAVRAVALSTALPLDGGVGNRRVVVEGRTGGDESMRVSCKRVTGAYLDTVGITIVAGERPSAGAATGVMINAAMARALWKTEGQAIGARLRIDGGAWLTVAAVAADVRQLLTSPASPEIYLPLFSGAAAPPSGPPKEAVATEAVPGAISLVIRTAGDPLVAAPFLVSAARTIDPDVPVSDVVSMEGIVDSYVPRPLIAAFALLSVVALLLSALGLYAVVAFHVTRRTREFGIRLALGSNPAGLLRLVVSEGLRLTAIGLVAGGAGGALIGQVLASRFTEVRLGDPALAGGVALVLALVSLSACLLPARRATRVSPAAALRCE